MRYNVWTLEYQTGGLNWIMGNGDPLKNEILLVDLQNKLDGMR